MSVECETNTSVGFFGSRLTFRRQLGVALDSADFENISH